MSVPRRRRIDLLTPTEILIRNAVLAVEDLGVNPLLTEAIVLLQAARDKVADFVELEETSRGHTPHSEKEG